MVEITPEASPAERAAALEALGEMVEGTPIPAPYRSAWRRAALEEAAGGDAGATWPPPAAHSRNGAGAEAVPGTVTGV